MSERERKVPAGGRGSERGSVRLGRAGGRRRGRARGRTDRELELALAAADRHERDLGAGAHGFEQLAKALGRAGLVDAHDERDAAELAQLAVEVALADLEQVARGDAVVAVRVVSRGRDEDDVLGRAGGGAQEVVAEARVAAAGGSCRASGLARRHLGESERERGGRTRCPKRRRRLLPSSPGRRAPSRPGTPRPCGAAPRARRPSCARRPTWSAPTRRGRARQRRRRRTGRGAGWTRRRRTSTRRAPCSTRRGLGA